MAVLVTGGAGYIGSHTGVELLNAGYEIIIVDNFSNSSPESLRRVKEITGKDFKFYEIDLLDKEKLETIFKENKIDSCVHFAGLKAVGESVEKPMRYYHNNLLSTLNLCELLAKYDVKKIVFSSSATVYGLPERVPITEDMPTSTTNPYGATKLMIENILTDIYNADKDWSISILRYFNPIGAHESGLIGENPNGIPNNLMPFITQVAVGKLKELNVFGNDYPTHDGTGVRDYIHVVDLSIGHLKALNYLSGKTGVFIHNLGTGTGYSVLDILKAFENANDIKIPYKIADRRSGDIAECFADAEKSKKELGFEAKFELPRMCKDSWNFQKNNPNGF